MKNRIIAVNGKLNEDDRLEIARLLIKAGYTVRICKEKQVNKTTSAICIEYSTDEN